MSKILDPGDLLVAAWELREQGKLSNKTYVAMEKQLVATVAFIAETLANIEGVTHQSTDNQIDLGGVMSSFGPGKGGKTSDAIGNQDPTGEW